MRKQNRQTVIKAIWEATHSEYRSNGAPYTVMIWAAAYGKIVALDDKTDEELMVEVNRRRISIPPARINLLMEY